MQERDAVLFRRKRGFLDLADLRYSQYLDKQGKKEPFIGGQGTRLVKEGKTAFYPVRHDEL